MHALDRDTYGPDRRAFMDTDPSIRRRLAAILAADIAGYSRLMGEDEARTVRDLKGHQAVVLPLIGRYGGRVIDTAGDGILAEFPGVIGAPPSARSRSRPSWRAAMRESTRNAACSFGSASTSGT